MLDKISCDVVVVGAGAVGLASAAALAAYGHKVIVLEREPIIGAATSSRNSEVIHSGVYYAPTSQKAKLCLRGKRLLYSYLKKRSINHHICGKILFCQDTAGEERLSYLYQNALRREISVSCCSNAKLQEVKRFAAASSAIEIFDTGIFDSHAFLQSLAGEVENKNGVVALKSNVLSIEPSSNRVTILCKQGNEEFVVDAKHIINAAGNEALSLIKSLFTNKYKAYNNYYVKGHYFSYTKKAPVHHLFYPLPTELGLGVHSTLDLQGNIRFGPDTLPVKSSNNFHQEISTEKFHRQVKTNFPGVAKPDLSFSYCGIRPKVKINEDVCDDFIFMQDLGGRLISAVNIESPGLTASLAIGELLRDMIEQHS